MKRTLFLTLGAAMALTAATSSQAQITLHLDTTAKELWFTGSDSGSTQFYLMLGEVVAWYAGSGGLSFNSVPMSTSLLNPTVNSFASPAGSVYAYEGSGKVEVYTLFASSGAVTLNGGGYAGRVSYGAWGAGQKANLESYIGSSLPRQAGSGFRPISVVPEPGTYALIAGLGLVGFAGFRRLRQRA